MQIFTIKKLSEGRHVFVTQMRDVVKIAAQNLGFLVRRPIFCLLNGSNPTHLADKALLCSALGSTSMLPVWT